MKRKCLCVCAMALTASAFADGADPYADYVKLMRRDTGSSYNSWMSAGGWSDKLAPHPEADYYVAEGALLWCPHSYLAEDHLWKGGKLVVKGDFCVCVSGGNSNARMCRI